MASLVPTRRFRSVDFPAFGRPISETKPNFTRRPLHHRRRSGQGQSNSGSYLGVLGVLRRGELGNPHAVDVPPLGVEHLDAQSVDVEPLANSRDTAELGQQLSAD